MTSPSFNDKAQLYDRLVVYTHGETWTRSGHPEECIIRCPSCGHDGSKSDMHFSFSERGAKCFSCGWSSGLRGLAEKLGYSSEAPFAKQHAQEDRKRKAPAKSDKSVYVPQWKQNPEMFLQRYQAPLDLIPLWQAYRPFDLESISKWQLGVGVLPSCSCKHRRLVYPVVVGGKVMGLRGRSTSCSCSKWLQSSGSDAQLFNQEALVPGCIALIIESPIDVMLIEQFLRTVPRPGLLSHPIIPIAGTAGAGTWKPEWSRLLQHNKVAGVLVWLDNDLAGNPNGKTRAHLLAEWNAKYSVAKAEPKPSAPKVMESLRKHSLLVEQYNWPDDADAKADWGWILSRSTSEKNIQEQKTTDWSIQLLYNEAIALQNKLRKQTAPCDDAPTLPTFTIDAELPDDGYPTIRTIKPYAGEAPAAEYVSLSEARTTIVTEKRTYSEQQQPETILLVKTSPGVGKTTAAVALAEKLAGEGKRILYCGLRHDFFVDILREAKKPTLWHQWLPRQKGDDGKGRIETCRHTDQMNTWLNRRHEANDFCKAVCGYQYMRKSCAYHKQKNQAKPIIFAMHQHLVNGLPLDFDVVIVDENPMSVFEDKMIIPAAYVAPPGMDYTDNATHVVHELASLAQCSDTKPLEGPELLRALRGARVVFDAADSFSMPLDAKELTPQIRVAGDADRAPYFYLPMLFSLLKKEADAAMHGRDYPARVRLQNGSLTLLMRHALNNRIAQIPHMICLDATANEHIYETLFHRSIKVIAPKVKPIGAVNQFYSSGHGITSMVNEDRSLKPKVKRLQYQVSSLIKKHNYRHPVVVTYKVIADAFRADGIEVLTFGAARGTNAAQKADALFVIGTYQVPPGAIRDSTAMIFFDRMEPFDLKKGWTTKDIQYPGLPWVYPVPGFWNDPDLNAVLQQNREAEIEQAVHRSRINTHDCVVWLFSPLPLLSTLTAQLLTENEAQDAPEDVNMEIWHQLMILADEHFDDQEPLRSTELVECLDTKSGKPLVAKTARRYLEKLVENQSDRWTLGTVAQAKKGRPILAAMPRTAE